MNTKSISSLPVALVSTAAAFLLASTPQAEASLFGVTVDPQNQPEFSITGGSIVDLTEDLLQARGRFGDLEGQPWTADVLYFAQPGALTFESNADRTDVVLRSPLTGLEQRFQGADSDEVEDAIADWLKQDGASELANLDKEIRKRSAVAISDGNPNAATALIADSGFQTFALGRISNGIKYSYGQFTADTPSGSMDGEQHKISFRPSFRTGERLAVMLDIPLDYTEIEDTQIAGIGTNLGLRINVLPSTDTRAYHWSVTPFAGALARLSADAASGAFVWHAGAASKFDYPLTEKILLTVGNQLSTFDDIGVEYDDYKLEQDISQTIMKNGARLVYLVRPRVEVDASLINTHFFDDAAIENYWTAAGGIAYRFGEKGGTVGAFVNTDLASDYDAWSVGLALGRKW